MRLKEEKDLSTAELKLVKTLSEPGGPGPGVLHSELLNSHNNSPQGILSPFYR